MSEDTSPQRIYTRKDEEMAPAANEIQHLEDGGATSPDFSKIQSTKSIMLSPEAFEKLYLNPKTPVAGHLRSIIGNPTPL